MLRADERGRQALRLGPVAPMSAEDRLLGLGRGAVGRGSAPPSPASRPARDRRAARPGRRTRPRGPPIRTADRRSSWAARPVGMSSTARPSRTLQLALVERRGAPARSDCRGAAATYTAVAEPSHRLELELGRAHAMARPVGDRQVLDGRGMPILQAGIADLAAREVPAPADRLDGLDRPMVALGQPVERVTARSRPAGRRVSSSTRKSSGWHLSFMSGVEDRPKSRRQPGRHDDRRGASPDLSIGRPAMASRSGIGRRRVWSATRSRTGSSRPAASHRDADLLHHQIVL